MLLLSVNLFAQSKIDATQLKVFSPDENSIQYNEIYTQNFFFGNLGLKQLMSAIPINNQSVKTMKIAATNSMKKNQAIMELHYDQEGKIHQMKIFEAFFGDVMVIDYRYKEGLLDEEIITHNNQTKRNKFYYTDGKMIVENTKGILDVYSLNGKVLSKTNYMDGNLLMMDKMEGKCRLTLYRKQPINKVCFSNLNLEYPLTIDEFSNNEDKNGKLKLEKNLSLTLKKVNEFNYSILSNNNELYTLKLTKDMRVKELNFLGVKAEHVSPVDYTFNYINY
ncbi:MAG: hypothetical protein WCY77_00335 [Weeksellaceae bacterium]